MANQVDYGIAKYQDLELGNPNQANEQAPQKSTCLAAASCCYRVTRCFYRSVLVFFEVTRPGAPYDNTSGNWNNNYNCPNLENLPTCLRNACTLLYHRVKKGERLTAEEVERVLTGQRREPKEAVRKN